MLINSLPIFFDSQTIFTFSPPDKTWFSIGATISIEGPSIVKFFFDIPRKEPSKFSIFIKHFLLFIAGTCQLYFPSFSVIETRLQVYPSSEEK
tara:strand:+ start:1045 stop:1323 length:279 start_codon:yes stop_codon:yes gene_type:complete